MLTIVTAARRSTAKRNATASDKSQRGGIDGRRTMWLGLNRNSVPTVIRRRRYNLCCVLCTEAIQRADLE